jgi:hypothetical protein
MPKSRHDQSITKTVGTYRAIEAYITNHGHSPTLQEITDKCPWFTAKFMTHWHVLRLKEWGLLESKPGLPRTIRLHPVSGASTDVQKYFEVSHAK